MLELDEPRSNVTSDLRRQSCEDKDMENTDDDD